MNDQQLSHLINFGLGGYLTLLFIVTHLPAQTVEPWMVPGWSDLVHHVLAYLLCGFLISLRLACVLSPNVPSRDYFLTTGLVLGTLLGTVDELTQPITGRVASLYDWFADIVGVMLGLSFAAGALRVMRLFKSVAQESRDIP